MGTIETDRFESVNSPPWISGMVAFAKRGILFLIAFGEGIFSIFCNRLHGSLHVKQSLSQIGDVF